MERKELKKFLKLQKELEEQEREPRVRNRELRRAKMFATRGAGRVKNNVQPRREERGSNGFIGKLVCIFGLFIIVALIMSHHY